MDDTEKQSHRRSSYQRGAQQSSWASSAHSFVNPVDHATSVSQPAFSTRVWLSLQKEKIYGYS